MSEELSFLTLNPVEKFLGIVHLPGSKSISNRALLLASIAEGSTRIGNLLISDDVEYMLNGLRTLGVSYEKIDDNGSTYKIQGGIKFMVSHETTSIYLGNAGTVMRFLTAMLSLRRSNVILTGDERMKNRPIGHLVDALRQGGAVINYLEKPEFPPLQILGGFHGGKIVLDGSVSSQFLSALLMAAPLADNDTEIVISKQLVSEPYVKMTINVMARFGVHIINQDNRKFVIKGNQRYQSPKYYVVEGDATSASYFLAGGAIKGGPVRVIGIDHSSIQGDIEVAHVLEQMGALVTWGDNYIECSRGDLNGIDVDLNHLPDAAMTIAIVALFAKGISHIRNIANWRVKESDRIGAMAAEMRKIGAKVHEGDDFITIEPPIFFRHAEIKTYHDHRIAMCFSLVALSEKTLVTILNPNCTKKTFPGYFEQFTKLTK